ncbi:MAG TPA: CCA tRNA nucleotidyltransferase [Syntrophales bacterium]|nr:CCA tRNA nucleotidyltransferase [Syntrophales bacterium]HRT27212.1 CCA tRNA nucleotidyltransferase [Syntrophales bacterium]HRT70751.1 CCA tRNA nucleotidyltransferase [Syntrophales bacterium]
MVTVQATCRPTVYFETAARVVKTLKEAGHEAYFVGGSVRDILRGLEPVEFDIVTSATPKEVRALFDHTVAVGEKFGVILVIEEGLSYEVATYRIDRAYEDGRRPLRVEFAALAEEDVRRRDFTVNGLLMDPGTCLVFDYVGGVEDLKKRIIRTIGDPEERFAEDHLRMLRAVRLAANLGFEVEPATFAAIKRNAKAIRRISAERIRNEITRTITRGGARRGMELLADSGLLAEVLPEVEALRGVTQPERFHPDGDVWEHTLRMLDMLPGRGKREADPRLAWGVLLHDVGKPLTRSEDARGIHFYGHSKKGEEIAEAVMQRLRFPRSDVEAVVAMIRHHMLFINVMDMRPNRLKRFLRMPDFELHLELHRLDSLASHGNLENYEFCRKKLAEFASEDLRPPPLITGKDLIAMGFEPGPLFKEIKRCVEDAQLDGEISTPEEARRLVLEKWGGRRKEEPRP